jgi:hypothetical protein
MPDPEPGNGCANPFNIDVEDEVFIEGNNTSTGDYLAGSCGGQGGSEQVFMFEMDSNYDLVVEVTGYEAILYLQNSCGASQTELACNNNQNTELDTASTIEIKSLPKGVYYLIVDSVLGGGFEYDLAVRFKKATTCPDSDGDGLCNSYDLCPDDPDKQEVGICGCGHSDADFDQDGTVDCFDACPEDPEKTEVGACGCGIADIDGDRDGEPDCSDACPNDPNKVEPGALGCNVLTVADLCPNDPKKTRPGLCGCGLTDADKDNDSVPDCLDACPDDPLKTAEGECGCGVTDDDANGDGIPECAENQKVDEDAGPQKTTSWRSASDAGIKNPTNIDEEYPTARAGGCGCAHISPTKESYFSFSLILQAVIYLFFG